MYAEAHMKRRQKYSVFIQDLQVSMLNLVEVLLCVHRNSGHKQIRTSKLFSHIYQPSVK